MKIMFKNQSIAGDFDVSDALADFFIWLAQHRQNKQVESLLVLLAEHDRETDEDGKKNIRLTIDEILEDKPPYLRTTYFYE